MCGSGRRGCWKPRFLGSHPIIYTTIALPLVRISYRRSSDRAIELVDAAMAARRVWIRNLEAGCAHTSMRPHPVSVYPIEKPNQTLLLRRLMLLFSAVRAENIWTDAEIARYNRRMGCGECISTSVGTGPDSIGTSRSSQSLWPLFVTGKARSSGR